MPVAQKGTRVATAIEEVVTAAPIWPVRGQRAIREKVMPRSKPVPTPASTTLASGPAGREDRRKNDREAGMRRIVLGLLLGAALAGPAMAQERTIRLVSGFAAGGASDLVARLAAEAIGRCSAPAW